MNTQKQLVEALMKHPLTSETDIFKIAFGFDRRSKSPRCRNNKKYAELLRRAWNSNKIERVELKIKDRRERYFYYVPR
jgi:hypothetical protein